MNVLLDPDKAKLPLLQARWSRTDRSQELPRSLIKLSHVPHNVHVAHLVAVPRVNNATVRNQRFGHEGILPRQPANRQCVLWQWVLKKKLASHVKWPKFGDRKCLAIGEDRSYRVLTQFHFRNFCGNEFFNTHAILHQPEFQNTP
jgi:hypothetical protein